MLIYDITNLLQTQFDNCYIFNPSIIYLSGSVYLVAYRICKYNYPDNVDYHNPWKTWDNGYKLFSNPARLIALKYRSPRDFDGSSQIKLTKSPEILPLLDEYDSTCLAVIEFLPYPKILYNVNQIFGQRMYQDARLWRRKNDIYISYNIFHSRDNICLRKRTLEIDLQSETCYLGAESLLFDHIYQRAEKNCVPGPFGKDILYAIGYTLDIMIKDGIFKRVPCPLSEIIDYYGKDKIECSLSTPAIKYKKNRWIACAHIKVHYKKIDKDPLKTFLSNFSFKPDGDIYPHGKYIYFAYFFEFNKNYKITRHSRLFIPSLFGDHIPYLLVMPMGLCWFDSKIMLSYGDGDKRCKLLILTSCEMEQLLDNNNGACLLTETAPSIQHVGYFGCKNTGDDAFIKVFSYLQKKYYPRAQVEYINPSQNSTNKPDITILGGGDVINKYFLLNFQNRKRMTAVSVGVPYQEFNNWVSIFDKVFCRSKLDLPILLEHNPSVEYFPDLCFLLPKIYKPPKVIHPNIIGISVLRTYYNPDFLEIYQSYISNMGKWIEIILRREPEINFLLIPFGINPNKNRENDMITCKEIANLVNSSKVKILQIDESKADQVEHIYCTIKNMSFMVCARFHSHIFSASANVPFVSLTCGKKCIDFMLQSGLEDYMYKFKKNEVDLPIDLDAFKIAQFVHHHYHQRGVIQKKISSILLQNSKQMEIFEEKYIQMLKEISPAGSLIFQDFAE